MSQFLESIGLGTCCLILIIMVSNMSACTEYTYPRVVQGSLQLDEARLPELAKADTKEQAQKETAVAIASVKEVTIPKENKWQDRIIGVALAVGALLVILGVVLALYGQQLLKGSLLALSGLTCILLFVVLYATMAWIQENTGKIVLGFSSLAAAGLAYYFYFNHGTTASLIRSFELQKDKLWKESEADVKDAQGSFQKHISSLRKRVLKK